MTDQDRHEMATEFVTRWLEPDTGEPGYPRAMATREAITMAIGHLLDRAVLETREDRSGGDVVDLDRIIESCLFGDQTT